jgi:hypothetical protein
MGCQLGAMIEGKRKEAHPFNRPAEDGCFEVLCLGEFATFENSDRVNDAQSPIELSTGYVVIHALWVIRFVGPKKRKKNKGSTNASVIFNGFFRHVAFTEVSKEVIADDGIDCLETFTSNSLILGGRDWGSWDRDWVRGSSNGSHEWARVVARQMEFKVGLKYKNETSLIYPFR